MYQNWRIRFTGKDGQTRTYEYLTKADALLDAREVARSATRFGVCDIDHYSDSSGWTFDRSVFHEVDGVDW